MRKTATRNLLPYATEIIAVVLVVISILITHYSLSVVHEMEITRYRIENSQLLMELSREKINTRRYGEKINEAASIIRNQEEVIKELLGRLRAREYDPKDAT